MTDCETHRNDERTVKCPVEGCEAEVLARGINLHVHRTAGDGHGPQGDVPDHITFDDLETVGRQEVEMDYPEKRDTPREMQLCPYCGRTFAGIRGVSIHLGQVAGQGQHPEDSAEEYDPEDSPRVAVEDEVDSDMRESIGPSRPPIITLTARVHAYVQDLYNEGQVEDAERARRQLLGTADDDALDPTRAVLGALLQEDRTEGEEPRVRAALHNDSIYLECRGTSVLLSADDARWLANVLELVADYDDWTDTPEKIVEYLREGADVLDGDLSERHFVANHLLWGG